MPLAETSVQINLRAIVHNFRVLEGTAPNSLVVPVLKSDFYGQGATSPARALQAAGARMIAVARVEEASALRDRGITTEILLMGGVPPGTAEEIVARKILPVVSSPGEVQSLAAAAERFPPCAPVEVHAKIDTGMSRLGARVADLDELLHAIELARGLRVTGAMTHFVAAGGEGATSSIPAQLDEFRRGVDIMRQAGHQNLVLHAANSAATFCSAAGLTPDARLDAVRPGIALFGVAPGAPSGEFLGLEPVVAVRSSVISIRAIPAGTGVGYGPLWRAVRSSRIATVPFGYADGLPRAVAGAGRMLVRGKAAPIVGAVSMDLVMLDVTDIPFVDVGDEVVVVGEQKGEHDTANITLEDLAAAAQMIPWEVLVGLGRRSPRYYLGTCEVRQED